MDRYYLENRDAVMPDQETEDQKPIARTGDQHEHAVLNEFKSSVASLVEHESLGFIECVMTGRAPA